MQLVRKAASFLIRHGSLGPVTINGKPRYFGGTRSYSFPKAVIQHLLRPILWLDSEPYVPSVSTLMSLFDFDILWRGNPLILGPKYGTTECILCLKESACIYYQRRRLQDLLVNSRANFQFCQHKVLSGSPTLLTESGAEDAD